MKPTAAPPGDNPTSGLRFFTSPPPPLEARVFNKSAEYQMVAGSQWDWGSYFLLLEKNSKNSSATSTGLWNVDPHFIFLRIGSSCFPQCGFESSLKNFVKNNLKKKFIFRKKLKIDCSIQVVKNNGACPNLLWNSNKITMITNFLSLFPLFFNFSLLGLCGSGSTALYQ